MKQEELERLQSAVDSYFEGEAIPTRSGLCLALGVTYEDLTAMQKGYASRDLLGKRKAYDADLARLTQRAIYRLNDALERRAGVAYITEALQAAGVIETEESRFGPPFDLGRYKKYAR